jgi:hypothetical protein
MVENVMDFVNELLVCGTGAVLLMAACLLWCMMREEVQVWWAGTARQADDAHERCQRCSRKAESLRKAA